MVFEEIKLGSNLGILPLELFIGIQDLFFCVKGKNVNICCCILSSEPAILTLYLLYHEEKKKKKYSKF